MVDQRQMKNLLDYDPETELNTWKIILSPPIDITTRLTLVPEIAEAPEVIEERTRRKKEKICPTPGCGKPRTQLTTGAWRAYCKECTKVRSRAYRELTRSREYVNERKRRLVEGICAKSGCSNKRHILPGGRQLTICKSCKRKENQRYYYEKKVRATSVPRTDNGLPNGGT